ncbi:MAG TPA: cupin-like domain-containing protein [Burkholderiaceae bacterium]|nr:cupin-like domain-containing protein [Burkholderiaceae bacterium]
MLGEFVSSRHAAELVEAGHHQDQPLLALDPQVTRESYNRLPYLVQHRLHHLAEFELGEILALCRRLPREQVQFRTAVIPGDADFDSSYERFAGELTLATVLEHFEELQAYICVYNPERDAKFRPLLESILAEIAAAIEHLDSPITWYSTYLFVSAHDAVTPYHMDREMNFLLQIRGEKRAMLWDPADDEIMSAAEKDKLLAYDGLRPAYKPSFEAKAMAFDLRPGLGVHHPFIAPHRVHTGANLSISLAFTFRTQQSDQRTRAHAFNYALRRRGLSPQPVGRHQMLDRAKALALQVARARHAFHHH